MNVYEVLSTLKKLSKSSGFASPSLVVSVVQSIGSWGQPFVAFTGFEFVIFGPWKRQDRFCKFISMDAGGEKWWTGGYGWEMNTLQPFVHLWSEINTVRVYFPAFTMPCFPLLVPHWPLSTHGGLEEMRPNSFYGKQMLHRLQAIQRFTKSRLPSFRLFSDLSQVPMHFWSAPQWLTLVGRWPLSCRFLCQVHCLLLRVLRPHGVRRGKGSFKMPCQVRVGFEVRQDCDTFDVSWVPTNSRIF